MLHLVLVAVAVGSAAWLEADVGAGVVLRFGRAALLRPCLDPPAQGCEALGRHHPATGLLVKPGRK